MPNQYKNQIEVTIRAVICKDDEILVCKYREKDYCFFPGGHLEFGEKADEALIREMKEEAGLELTNCNFIGALENFFIEDDEDHHEIILAFEGSVYDGKLESLEDHLDFFWKDTNELVKGNILPLALSRAIIKWLEDKKPFWESQIN
ncbi:MAG: ADP-ribose pyrophosphatase [Candidatus Nealsonbacteria bacterium CG_4_10_14_0_2_um_filter_38_17]|uniref:ADP-ribose pyrophosphatase n=2 Tax=Candidatus Nealsoniibacteriota TaxID=1817911 RepID=A0A2M7UYH2_9BACT|nr:MAG: ADP-ribose pyrophosphatase [Candidatus Nealsonbacteria bacterium CG23_combo_of_CG06-09_8_20_14_all_38_19]PIZ89007.1 MAG: ADP-ribose pyrophosphatase [Candidatus Nealsonbacteria bacterium CG_4_10_14_0_2_um_filter_38_17]